MSVEEQVEASSREGLSLVLPAFNEVHNIGPMLDAVRRELSRIGRPWEVVVVDDGSTDWTCGRVREHSLEDSRISLVEHTVNQGYGAALRTGFAHTRHELVCFTDADRQFHLDDLNLLLERIEGCHLVAGFRAPRVDPWRRRMLGRAWTVGMNRLHGVNLRDVNCAFKLIRREALDSLYLESRGAFINAEIVIGLRAQGFIVEECPVRHRPRPLGSQSGANPSVIGRAVMEAILYSSSRSVSGPRNWCSRMASLTRTRRYPSSEASRDHLST